ncbi:MAG: LapA family protein [Rhodospirillaceae bacterium]|nr:LapA family protein [Rhodospirillaceae bacterium]
MSFICGWIAGLLSAWHFVRRLTRERAHLRRQLRLAEAELKNVRPLSRDGV